jgi:hypothetical protein
VTAGSIDEKPERRDGAAAKQFFRRLLKDQPYKPKRLITDGLGGYAWPDLLSCLTSNIGPADT